MFVNARYARDQALKHGLHTARKQPQVVVPGPRLKTLATIVAVLCLLWFTKRQFGTSEREKAAALRQEALEQRLLQERSENLQLEALLENSQREGQADRPPQQLPPFQRRLEKPFDRPVRRPLDAALQQLAEVAGVEAPLHQFTEPLKAVKESPTAEDTTARAEPKTDADAVSRAFPDAALCEKLQDAAEFLPDIIHIPFEEAIADEVLRGWEDEWLAEAKYDGEKWGSLPEPKIDFIYSWVNGSDEDFHNTIYEYELNSPLNDAKGKWISSHGMNRYRDWDELRYSFRSVEKHAGTFYNKIQVLVNAVKSRREGLVAVGKQRPTWLNDDPKTKERVEVISQEEYFGDEEMRCLPTFNSLTMENQIYNTESDVDRFVALSDDMLLGRTHAASDFYSPLFGPTMGFKSNGYNTINPPTETDALRFGEKPFLIYTSWLLNRRFGQRKRKGQVHFGHSLSRSVTREALSTFPAPAAASATERFRGELGFQLYSWYASFHYIIERQREALLWSFIMHRSDADGNGNLDWSERQVILTELEEGMSLEGKNNIRDRTFYRVPKLLKEAGLQPPNVNVDILWTSLDGPLPIRDLECFEFDVEECLAPGFSSRASDVRYQNPIFSTASIFDRIAHSDTQCGDCFIKLLLNRAKSGLSPMLPHKDTQAHQRIMVLKALMRYQYTVMNPDALFVMVTDVEQVQSVLLDRLLYQGRDVGQLCLNDDVETDDRETVEAVQKVIKQFYEGLLPEKSSFEI